MVTAGIAAALLVLSAAGVAGAAGRDGDAAVAGPDSRAAARAVVPMAGGTDVSDATTISSLPYSDTGVLTAGSGSSAQDAVWAVTLAEGDKLYVEATYTTGATGAAVALFLFKPGVTTVKGLPLEGDIVDEATYQGAGGVPSPLRMAYTVPAGKAGTYYIDLMCEWGVATYTLRVKNGPAEYAVTPSSNVVGWYAGSGSYASVTGRVDSAMSPYPYAGTQVEVWARWRGYDRNGLDRQERLGTTTIQPDGTWTFYPVQPDSSKMPWTSTLCIEWPGKNDMAADDKGWCDDAQVIEVYPYVSTKPSRWAVNRRQALYITGRVYPSYARDAGVTKPKISLYVSRPGARGLRVARHYWLSSTGYYRFLQRPWIKGTWYYRVRFLSGTFYDAYRGTYYQRYRRGYSRTIRIRVR